MGNIDIRKFKKIDNELNYAFLYRNMYNYAVIVLALWYLFTVPAEAVTQALGVVLLVMGFKWLLTQTRENLDTIAINKTLSEGKDA